MGEVLSARSLGTLTIDLIAKIAGFTSGMDKAEREAQKRAKAIKGAFAGIGRTIAAGLAGIGVGIGFKAVIDATIDAEKAFALLDNAVKQSGGAAGRTTGQLSDMAGELQRLTTFDDEAIMGAEQLLLRFRSIQGTNFDGALKSTLDLSAALGIDLQSAAKLVGKALEDPVKGVNQLARSGVVLSEQQKELVKRLVETGDKAGAQRVILDELNRSVGNAAASLRNTLGGALTGLKNAFGDLLEGKGGSVSAATQGINDFADLLNSEQVKTGASALVGTLFEMASLATNASLAVAKLLEQVGKLPFAAEQLSESGRLLGIVSEGFARIAGNWSETDELRKSLADVDAALNNSFLGKPMKYWGKSEEDLKAIREGIVSELEKIKKAAAAPAAGGGTPAEPGAEGAKRTAKELADLARAQREEWERSRAEFSQYLETIAREQEALSLVDGVFSDLADDGQKAADSLGKMTDELLHVPEVDFGDVKEKATELSIFMEEAFRGTQSALSDGLLDAMNGSFKSIGANFKRLIDQIVADILAARIAEKIFGKDGTGGGWLDAGLGILKGVFGGGRAGGGHVAAGGLYEVNEGGTELLTVGSRDYLMMGRQSGTVTPNHRLGGGGFSSTVNVTLPRDAQVTRRTGTQIANKVVQEQRIAQRLA